MVRLIARRLTITNSHTTFILSVLATFLNIRLDDDLNMLRLHGMAPPRYDAPKYRINDDLSQHDDGESFSALLHNLDDDSLQSNKVRDDGIFHRGVQHDLDLSTDIGELLYGADDTYGIDDDDEDLLTYYLRKRETGFKAMANSDQSPGLAVSERLALIAGEEENEFMYNDGNDDHVQDDQTLTEGQENDDDDEENQKDTIWMHRPKQNRTGAIWEGWPDETRVSDVNWWRRSRMCFEVDYICHKRNSNTWFYYETTTQQTISENFQPSMRLRSEPLRYDRGLIAEERVNITVNASSKIKEMTFIDDSTFQFNPAADRNQKYTCRISPIPTHMVLQSMFNYMIGEFYARTLLPLYRLMTLNYSLKNVSASSKTLKPWEQDIQFYVHLSHGNQKLYDGHKLLLSGMLSREVIAEVKSMVDLFVSDKTKESSEGTEQDDCECFEKMVFCGYDAYIEDGEKNTSGDDNIHQDERGKQLTPDLDVHYTLWSSSTTADDVDRKGYCGKGEIALDLYSCDEWAELRQFLSSNFLKHYSSLNADVIKFRKDALATLNLIDNSYNDDTQEWKVVGLAQRSYRRSWINLSDIMDECNSLNQNYAEMKVACIEVNVEKTLTPYDQLLLHQSVDVLIGVHGAQLTQAVLLPPHAHVLELLPWVTDYIRGSWVQSRHTPTPLGIIFHNTDLNHLGYSLSRDSVPMCEGIGEVGSDEEKDCFMGKQNKMKFIWESRDFTVKIDIILQYIKRFVMSTTNKCSEMKNALDRRFVQYNVWCETDAAADDKKSNFDPTLTLRHYYDYGSAPVKKRKKKKKHNENP